MRSTPTPTGARSAFAALPAEVVLGWRLAVRHAVSRAAVGWAVGLTALTRAVAGPSPEAVAPVFVGLAGLIGAAAGPRAFVRGGPFESFRWLGIAPAAAVVGRLAGTVAFSCFGAGVAAVLVAGPSALSLPILAGGAVHAAAIAAFAATLAPGFGCTAGTVLPLLLVAVGAGAPYSTFVLEAGPPVVPLPPPGMLIIGVLEGRLGAHGPALGAWLALAAAGAAGLARRVGPPGRTTAEPGAAEPPVVCEHLTSAEAPRPETGHPGLCDVTLAVEGGEIVAFVGAPRDGAGTLLRTAAGLAPVRGGRVSVRGGRARACRGFGYVRGGLSGPAELTIVEWLRYVADQYGGRAGARAMRVQAALALVGLGAEAGRRLGLLDRDASERLAVATCAVSGAAVLMLDACFAGVDAATRQLLTNALADLAEQGRTILLAPRDVRAVEAVATRVVVLRDGRVLADLRMTTLQRERVAELRLNGGALAAVSRITAHFPDATRTGVGMDVPLAGGRTLESVLALCRSERIPVLGSRVRYRAVDDLLIPGRLAPDPERAAAFG